MARHIKNFLAPKHGKINQGFFKPLHPDKYLGDVNKIIYRSGWEYQCLYYFDNNPKIIKYGIEPFGIPYYNPLAKRVNNYYIDFVAIMLNDKNEPVTWLLEVKPSRYLSPPVQPKRTTTKSNNNYMYAAKQYIINCAKFESAKKFCASRNWQFGILTEDFLKNI